MDTNLQPDLFNVTQSTRLARIAGALFFFICLPLALWDQMYVAQKIFVPQDPTATAQNLLSNEFIFRTSILTRIIGIVVFVFMVQLFYRIFKPVDKNLSRLMLLALLAQIPAVFVFEVLNYTALMILKSETRITFDVSQQHEVAYFLLRIPRYGAGPGLGKFFLGLCFIPFGLLILRSGFAPKIIGILVIIGGAGYLADCCIAVLLQRADYVIVRSFLMYTTLGYLSALLWFLIKGMRVPANNLIFSSTE